MLRSSVLIPSNPDLGGIPPGSVCVVYEISPKNFTQILGMQLYLQRMDAEARLWDFGLLAFDKLWERCDLLGYTNVKLCRCSCFTILTGILPQRQGRSVYVLLHRANPSQMKFLSLWPTIHRFNLSGGFLVFHDTLVERLGSFYKPLVFAWSDVVRNQVTTRFRNHVLAADALIIYIQKV